MSVGFYPEIFVLLDPRHKYTISPIGVILQIAVSILSGLIGAWLLYGRGSGIPLLARGVLGALRAVLIGLLVFVLWGISFIFLHPISQKPSVAIAVDRSKSMLAHQDRRALTERVALLYRELLSYGFDPMVVDQYGLFSSDSIQNMRFDLPTSNIQKLLAKAEEISFLGKMHSIVLLSDGIANEGLEADQVPCRTPVHVWGVGDTTRYADASIQRVFYNKLVSKNVISTFKCLIQSSFPQGTKTKLQFLVDNKLVATKEVTLDKALLQVEQQVTFDREGVHEIFIRLLPVAGDRSPANNQFKSFVEVLGARKKVHLYYSVPHPDVRAVGALLSENMEWEASKHHLLQIDAGFVAKEKPDLVMLFVSDKPGAQALSIFESLRKYKIPVFFILHPGGSALALERCLDVQDVTLFVSNRVDSVGFGLEVGAEVFGFSESLLQSIETIPPFTVPVVDIKTGPHWKTLAFQKVGSVLTEKPLFWINTYHEQKSAILLGEGLWSWSMYARLEKSNASSLYAELMMKSVQALLKKGATSAFEVNPTRRVYLPGEPVGWSVLLYNDSREIIEGKSVKLVIKGGTKVSEFQLYTTTEADIVSTPALYPGKYTYTATVNHLSEVLTSSGVLWVQATDLEDQNSTANFESLRKLAANTEGSFAAFSESTLLLDRFKNTKNTMFTEWVESQLRWIDLWWMILLLFCFYFLELIGRKLWGFT